MLTDRDKFQKTISGSDKEDMSRLSLRQRNGFMFRLRQRDQFGLRRRGSNRDSVLEGTRLLENKGPGLLGTNISGGLEENAQIGRHKDC